MCACYKWHEFGIVKNCQELEDYLVGREYTHGDYCHYTSLAAINSILEKGSIWLSNVSEFNDDLDQKQFAQNKFYYSFCFSTGINENLPLWYMYSGMKGDGGRLRFSQNQIRKLINEGQYALYEWNEDTKELGEKVLDLENGKNMKLTFKDIIYEGDTADSTNVSLKYNTMTNYNLPVSEYQKYRDKNIGFLKGLIWYYEKETRLLVELHKKAKKVLEEGKHYKVLLTAQKIFESVKITLAPEAPSVEEVRRCYSSIDKHCTINELVFPSTYSGTVKMNFCKRCSHK